MSSESSPPPIRSRRTPLLIGAVAIGAIAAAAFGIVDRAKSKQEVSAWTDKQAVPTVHIVQAERGPSEEDLILPGNINAYSTGTLFARASGYVSAWHNDIGAHVTKGETLATISAPDLDQQLAQEKAQLIQLQAAVQQAQATADLGVVTSDRTSKLVAKGWSSAEQGDTDRLNAASHTAALAVAKANVVSQQAAVNRLEELARFEQVKAPFDGVVTARNVNIGDLVSAGGTSGRALFQVSDIHRMRVYVNVPQAFLGELKPGIKATLHLPGRKDTFEAELTSTSNSLTENSRTALIELQADNPDGKLWPGLFAEVHFHIPSDPSTLQIPATALVFGAQGMRVATLGANDKVALRPVTIGHNLGNRVEIESGLSMSDRLIDNPAESMQSGEVVQVAGAPGVDAAAKPVAAIGDAKPITLAATSKGGSRKQPGT